MCQSQPGTRGAVTCMFWPAQYTSNSSAFFNRARYTFSPHVVKSCICLCIAGLPSISSVCGRRHHRRRDSGTGFSILYSSEFMETNLTADAVFLSEPLRAHRAVVRESGIMTKCVWEWRTRSVLLVLSRCSTWNGLNNARTESKTRCEDCSSGWWRVIGAFALKD